MNIKLAPAQGTVQIKRRLLWIGKIPQGLKPTFILRHFAARLKSCPVTKPQRIDSFCRIA
jgi:hypothetical protein